LTATGASVRALARNPERTVFPKTVEVVRGDLTQPETLDRCLEGIETVFLVWTAPPAAVGAALERITSQARRIVFLSSPHKTLHPLFQGAQPNPLSVLHKQIEQIIETSRSEWTFLRPGMFAANALSWWAPQIRAARGAIRWPYLAAPTAPIHEHDIAAVAVRALTEDGHAGAEYVMTGPESLSQREQIAALCGSLFIEEITPDQAREELLPIMPLFAVNLLLAAWSAAAGQPALVTSTVQDITGRAPRTFSNWVADHAGAF
jgi:uncharacterized protein YbjT (DUF2867 family)